MIHGKNGKVRDAAAYFGTAFVAVVCAVLVTLLSSVSYRSVLSGKQESDSLRATMSYIRTQVKSHDVEGGVAVKNGVLVLLEAGGEYETRIFLNDGRLVEQYCEAGAPLDGGDCEVIAEASVFKPQIEGGLLTIDTDFGRLAVNLFAGGAA